MRRGRSIRIFLLSTVFLALATFLLGFFLGHAGNENTVKNSQAEEAAIEPVEGLITVESMTEFSKTKYVIREEKGYLVVYKNDDPDIFMQTGIPVTNLPEEVRSGLDEEIVFYNLETLYNFLENYSI